MNITVNGEPKETSPNNSILNLLNELEINAQTVVVECDNTIIKQEEYATTILQDGAVLELIRFVGGG